MSCRTFAGNYRGWSFGIGLGVAVGSLALVQGASAADMPRKAPVPAVAIDPWSGWYIGLHAGLAQQNSNFTQTGEGEWPFFPVESALQTGSGTGKGSKAGFIGGGQIGVNSWLTKKWIWGIEADFSGLSGTASHSNGAFFPTLPATGTTMVDSRVTWLATIRPRVGTLVNDSTLVYVTGGLAIAQVKGSSRTVDLNFPVPTLRDTSVGNGSTVVPGWALGGGAEWKVGGPWSVKAEYLYVSLTSADYTSFYTGAFAPFFGENNATKTQLHIARLGVNYKIGGDSATSAFADARGDGAIHNWSGLYAGANFGGVRGRSRATDLDLGNGPWNAVGDTFSADTTGVTGGIQAGYNWQWNSVVAGLEGDFGYLGFRGTQTSSFPVALGGGETAVKSNGGLFGTARGRLGYAWDQSLIYATGGVIVAGVGTTVNDPILDLVGPSPGYIYSSKIKTQTGWTLGVGYEYALMNNWSVKAEYLYFDLGTARVTGAQMNAPGNPVYGWDVKNDGSIIRLGFNRKI
ncbi:MAG: outer membrane beta-barrel protein [Pseudolabrys sp.]